MLRARVRWQADGATCSACCARPACKTVTRERDIRERENNSGEMSKKIAGTVTRASRRWRFDFFFFFFSGDSRKFSRGILSYIV